MKDSDLTPFIVPKNIEYQALINSPYIDGRNSKPASTHSGQFWYIAFLSEASMSIIQSRKHEVVE